MPSSASLAIVKQQTRSTAASAGISAALMLYFGYSSFFVDSAGGMTLEYTLKVGGWAMAVSALGLLTGMGLALLFDALASMVVGLGFLGCAALLLPGGDLQGLLCGVFGFMFISSGLRSWHGYRSWLSLPASPVPVAMDANLQQGSTFPSATAVEPEKYRPADRPVDQSDSPPPSARSPDEPPGQLEDQTPPDGFLTQFAPQDRSTEQ